MDFIIFHFDLPNDSGFAFDTNNEFYAYLATGIIMMILFHVFENIGANIGLLPLTGIPLPLHQSRGSALLSNMIGIGLILSMRYQAESTPKTLKEIAMITFYWYPKCSTCKNAKSSARSKWGFPMRPLT